MQAICAVTVCYVLPNIRASSENYVSLSDTSSKFARHTNVISISSSLRIYFCHTVLVKLIVSFSFLLQMYMHWKALAVLDEHTSASRTLPSYEQQGEL